jgi:Na+-driven multidrug efflux pump
MILIVRYVREDEILTLAASARTRIRFLGPAEVAAWGLLGTLWDVFEEVTESVADSCEVRVAMLLGSGRPEKAKMSAYKCIYLGFFMAMFLSAVLFILGDEIPSWLTNDVTLQRLLGDLIPLFGIGNIGLTLGTISWTAVGAQGRYRLATCIGFGGSWYVSFLRMMYSRCLCSICTAELATLVA